MKFLRTLGYFLFLFLFCLSILEILYKSQLWDFYSAELKAFNTPSILQNTSKKPFLGVFGDSFSATNDPYVNTLRDSLTSFCIVNHAIPGTGILETNLIASQRMKQFPASVVIYQIYIGNDLVNIRKQPNWSTLPFLKNCYYGITNYLKLPEWLNYKLSQKAFFYKFKRQTLELNPRYQDEEGFEPEAFSTYEKQLLRAEPTLIEETVLVEGNRKKDVQVLYQNLDTFVEKVSKTAQKIYILVYPHAMQVNDYYHHKYLKMGFSTPHKAAFMDENYPFVRHLTQHFANNKQVIVINPLKIIRKNDSPSHRTFFENDFHASSWGQQIVGAELAKIIATNQ